MGSLLVSHLQLIAMERGALPPQERVPFFVHVDEFQTFSSDAFASLAFGGEKIRRCTSRSQISTPISYRTPCAPP